MTHACWDYVFLKKPYSEDCKVPEASLAKMRHEFEYWYPMDLRVSGKDLIRNHLTMALYNHAAMWESKDLCHEVFSAMVIWSLIMKKCQKVQVIS